MLQHLNIEQIMEKIYAIFIDFLPTFKGNNSCNCKTYNFRIKVGNVQMVDWQEIFTAIYNFTYQVTIVICWISISAIFQTDNVPLICV